MIGVAEQHCDLLSIGLLHVSGRQRCAEGRECVRLAAPPRVGRVATVLFIVLTRLPRYVNTQIGCKPHCDSMIDHATSFRMTTWARLDLNASVGSRTRFGRAPGRAPSLCLCGLVFHSVSLDDFE